jgi:GWxTD domain-containing protein
MRTQKQRWCAGLVGLILAAGPALAAQAEPGGGPEVRAFRFYRADGNQTRVTAFVEVPYVLLAASPESMLRWAVSVRITDESGKQLIEQPVTWSGRARAELRSAQASALDMLDFTLAPGKYQVEVAVQDSVSGRRLVSTAVVEGYREPPAASDLMLSPAMRLATGSDTMPRQGERRWGNTLVTAATRLRLTPVRSKAFYLLEAYAPNAAQGTMQVQVIDSSGRSLLQTRPAAVEVAAGGSVLKGQLDLTGLPSGKYRMTVALDIGGHREERSESFEMADFQETLDKEAVRLAAQRETDEGFFAQMGEDQLNEAFAPLVYLAGADSLAVWKTGLSPAAKRQFLTRFWAARDPTPGTARNEGREAFYAKIDYANRNYNEAGRASTPGWRTDRGRIYIKFGEPGEMLDRRVTGTQSPPYQVWRYTQGKEQYYLFVDRSGFGAYKLMFTNDLRETSNPGFREILGHDAVQDVSRFLGIDLFFNDPSNRVADITNP